MAIDGNVSGLNRDVFSALQKVKDPKNMSETEAKELRSAIMKDNKIDAAEADLLQELTQDKSGNVKIEAQKTADFNPQAINFATAKAGAKSTLQVLTKPVDLNKLWNGGSDGWRQLMDLYSVSPVIKNQITTFTANKLQQAWANSSIGNGYGPLREVIGKAYASINGADPATQTSGRNLLYDAMKIIDQRSSDAIPDFLYNWVRPGGYL